jgi:D-aspartate ligase
LARKQIEAVVFGLFETGLGVIRSLGQRGIKVIGIDFKKDIGWYSRYVKPMKCPHPLEQEKGFIEWIHKTFSGYNHKYPVFFTSDDFLISFSRNRDVMSNYFRSNLADSSLLEQISNKYSQFQIASNAGIDLPATWLINELYDFKKIPENIRYPIFIKGQDVNSWRKVISGSIKGFLVRDFQELKDKVKEIGGKNVPAILQEVVLGPDTNHLKYCSYTTSSGEILAEFTLQKIRQNPIHFGVGAVVESIHRPELIEIGRKLFSAIGFKGIGSAEFKFDNRDGKLKLIEINPRYWQQNFLSTACGMNFPYLNYLDLLQESPQLIIDFKAGVKWMNRYMDFDSFLKYRKEGRLTFSAWRKSMKGKKVYHDFTWDDPIPVLYEIGFGWKLIKIPSYIFKRIHGRNT